MTTKLCYLIPLALAASACGDDPSPPPPPNPADASVDAGPADGGSLTVRVTHTTSVPFSAGAGPVSFVSADQALLATATGIRAIQATGAQAGQPVQGFSEWSLTSTGAGPAASGIAVLPGAARVRQTAVFLPSGRPQLGALEIGEPGAQGALLTEEILGAPLAGSFPAGLLAPFQGPGADALWIADAPFGPGGALRCYPYASWTSTSPRLVEDTGRSFAPAAQDLDGDGTDDVPVVGRAAVGAAGTIGLVAFSVLGNSANGAAGGVDAFDLSTGELITRVVVPVADTATTTFGFVGGVALTPNWLLVAAADKGPGFADVGGQLALYAIRPNPPFSVYDANPGQKYTQPSVRIATSHPNAVGVTVLADRWAFVLSAPFGADGGIDVVDLAADPPVIVDSMDIGPTTMMGFYMAGDPAISPDGTQILLGTELGVVRLTVERH